MGWIRDRYMKENHGLAHGRAKSERSSAPLRKIIETIRVGDGDIFGSGDKVKLECGHEVYTHGSSKARCLQCKKQIELNNIP